MKPTEPTEVLFETRLEKAKELNSRGVDPFGGRFPETQRISEVLDCFEPQRFVRVAGRLATRRDMGKTIFAHLSDESGKIQIYISNSSLSEQEFDLSKRLCDLGDILGVEGELFVTKTGERTIKASKIILLSKALRPLPDKWHGLTDTEQRYRQRYLDLIVNTQSREVLRKRFEMTREIRRFFEKRGFLEVETPMMQSIAGGAAARPFETFHNALGIKLYLRIAPELYLKRLLVGGFEKIFELNRNFRNEGISRKHNPEFTMLEAYWAYADFEMFAELVEDLISELAEKFSYKGPINFSPPFHRVRYRDAVKSVAGEDWFELSPQQRRLRCKQLGVDVSESAVDFEVTQEVFEKLVEARTQNPTFFTHLPRELVPLAKTNKQDPSVVDVFELVIGGVEISPGYSELNDPIAQRERLLEQSGGEVQALDEDFLLALEHGMPPAGGIGIGIDRLAMILTGVESIRDVIFFPLLRPKSG